MIKHENTSLYLQRKKKHSLKMQHFKFKRQIAASAWFFLHVMVFFRFGTAALYSGHLFVQCFRNWCVLIISKRNLMLGKRLFEWDSNPLAIMKVLNPIAVSICFVHMQTKNMMIFDVFKIDCTRNYLTPSAYQRNQLTFLHAFYCQINHFAYIKDFLRFFLRWFHPFPCAMYIQ